ncbi:MAG: hypothetical protein J0L83_13770 [Chitinophagales bacterium]|nr:hypothetical protein [Chitinophagales bacterium]
MIKFLKVFEYDLLPLDGGIGGIFGIVCCTIGVICTGAGAGGGGGKGILGADFNACK